MSYPQIVDYNEAIQHPETAFIDAELRQGRVRENTLGLPVALSGGFALTYTITTFQRKLAVRCFHRQVPTVEQRYNAIAKTTKALNSTYFVGFDFLPQGIRVRQGIYPIVKMLWVEGDPLGVWLDKNATNPSALEKTRAEFAALAAYLERHQIAHGDIQNGNVMMSPGGIKLIDYDGMFVPTLPIGKGSETGHKHFQHPGRAATHFGPRMDRFSFIALDLSLRALIENPSLHKRFREGGETIIFRANDFADPSNSEIFHILAGSPNLTVLAKYFSVICQANIDAVPSLEDFLQGAKIRISNIVPSSVATGSLAPIASSRPVRYLGPYPVLNTDDFAAVKDQVGNRIELIGRIQAVKRGVGKRGRGRLQPYVFVNFGHWRGNIVKLTIWSEGLAQLIDAPDEKWVGRWISAVGLVDQPYSGKHYNFKYTHVGITIHGSQQINIITENEASFRLGQISRTGASSVRVSGGLQATPSGSPVSVPHQLTNTDIIRGLQQPAASGPTSVQTMPSPPSPPPPPPTASISSPLPHLISRMLRVVGLTRVWHNDVSRASALVVACVTASLILVWVLSNSPGIRYAPRPNSEAHFVPPTPHDPLPKGPGSPSNLLPAHLEGQVEHVWDAATISVAGRKVNLFAIRAEGGKYASDVRGYILTWGNTVSCQLKPKDTYECRIVRGQMNVAEEALRRGWVRTDPSAPVDYQRAHDYAQREHNGLWRNGPGSDSPSTPPVLAPQPNVESDRLGPSFPCTKAIQPLASTICADPRLSRVDLMFVQAYQALRQQTGDAGSKSLRQEEVDFHNKVLRECGIPDQGKVISDANVRNCIEQFYTNQRTAWISRLSGPAYQEATRALEQHIVLQRHLGQLGYLAPNSPIDGVYGPNMRRAISNWQRSRGAVETGNLSDTDTLALERAVMNFNGEGRHPSQAQPLPQGGSITVCGRTEWYSLDQTPSSDPRFRFRGVWTGKWNEGRVCAWLVVRSVNGDGSAEIEYAFITIAGEKIAQSGRGQVQQDNLTFLDKEGTLLMFTLRLPSATGQISQLIGKFTDLEARTFDASFDRLL